MTWEDSHVIVLGHVYPPKVSPNILYRKVRDVYFNSRVIEAKFQVPQIVIEERPGMTCAA